MADINLLKDTNSPEDGSNSGKNKPQKEVELSVPLRIPEKDKTLKEQAPESIWSKLFGTRKPKTDGGEGKPSAQDEAKLKKSGFFNLSGNKPVVMNYQKPEDVKDKPLKAVKIPKEVKASKFEMPMPSNPVKSMPSQQEAKEEKEDLPLIQPAEPQPKKDKVSWLGRIFGQPKVKKVPEPLTVNTKEKAIKKNDIVPNKPIFPLKEVKPQPEVKPDKDSKPKPAKLEKVMPETKDQSEDNLTKVDELQPSTLGIDLMPEDLIGNVMQAKQRLVQLGLIVIGIVIVCGLTYAGLHIWDSNLQQSTTELEDQLSLLEKEIDSYQTVQAEVRSIKNRTSGIKSLLENHVYWTNFFQKLEEYTIDNVYYSSFGGDLGSGRISLSAHAKSFLDVGRQLLVFQEAEDFVDSVEINDARMEAESTSANEGGVEKTVNMVSFSISLNVVPEIFFAHEDVVTEPEEESL